MSLSPECMDRLVNWKFDSAVTEMLKEGLATDAERELVNALSASFGNCGWFWGSLGTVVRSAVESIVPEEHR